MSLAVRLEVREWEKTLPPTFQELFYQELVIGRNRYYYSHVIIIVILMRFIFSYCSSTAGVEARYFCNSFNLNYMARSTKMVEHLQAARLSISNDQVLFFFFFSFSFVVYY